MFRKNKKTFKSLVIGSNKGHIYSVCCALNGAGSEIDLIATEQICAQSRIINSATIVFTIEEMIAVLCTRILDNYDFIQICDEHIIKTVLESDIPLDRKVKLLPIISKNNFSHLISKIGLSEILAKNHIKTPKFFVASTKKEAVKHAVKLKFPVMIKIDHSGGGDGVFECKNEGDINSLDSDIFKLPVLIQEKIQGELIDLSSFFQQGKLIHFDYSSILETVNGKFRPSCVRKYYQPHLLDKKTIEDLKKIGEMLGLNSFTNISAIKTQDCIYFFEVDARANIWANYSKYIGNDISHSIKDWFQNGKSINDNLMHKNSKFPNEVIIPHFLRIKLSDILTNKHNALKYLPNHDTRHILHYIYKTSKFRKKIKSLKMKLRQMRKKLFISSAQ